MERKPKKSLGQNFLTSKSAVQESVEAGGVKKGDCVLEIGPGKGVLTRALLACGANVIAVEKDETLAAELAHLFPDEVGNRSLVIVSGDILTIDLASLGLRSGAFKVVANIPYYITGQLFRTLLSGPIQPSTLVLLVQKEVAERIARSEKESLLSLSIKAYGKPRYVSTVTASSFRPQPKVHSAIVAVPHISKDFFADITEEAFFKVLRAGFGSKRKQLINNLEIFASKPDLRDLFRRLSIDEKARAEDVPLLSWKELALALGQKQ